MASDPESATYRTPSASTAPAKLVVLLPKKSLNLMVSGPVETLATLNAVSAGFVPLWTESCWNWAQSLGTQAAMTWQPENELSRPPRSSPGRCSCRRRR